MVTSAYIHIPFCLKKCNYCSFVSFETLEFKDIYINSLSQEIKKNYQKEKLKTIYIGGGTPSLLAIKDFECILELLCFDHTTEITVELNPCSVDLNYLKNLYKLGINRLSFGVQSFNDDILKIIGRNHNKNKALNVIQQAQDAGFNNISIDLIYGLPEQTFQDYKETLEIANSLGVEHISLYGLKIEKGSKFYNKKPKNLPDLDTQADMYLYSVEYLTQQGFSHYEISNFAKNNNYSKHNLNYWNNQNYYGFGVAAHGYLNNLRYANKNNLKFYLNSEDKIAEKYDLTQQEMLEEEIFLGFRKMTGINVDDINKKFSIDFEKKYKNILQTYLNKEYVKKIHNNYILTLQGVLLSNDFLSEFIEI